MTRGIEEISKKFWKVHYHNSISARISPYPHPSCPLAYPPPPLLRPRLLQCDANATRVTAFDITPHSAKLGVPP